ncbi:MAG: hypothetical protein JSU07_06450 [Bacteroidetes bacterium]|nr:hypothetical protein [Bacteroidota bacterium]
MAARATGKSSGIIIRKKNIEKDEKTLKEFFQTDKVSITTTVTLKSESKTSKHKNR